MRARSSRIGSVAARHPKMQRKLKPFQVPSGRGHQASDQE
jgi:hypothetical protein